MNMSYRESMEEKAATAIRDIAGGHLFDNGNKRTAQEVAEYLFQQSGRTPNSEAIGGIIDRVGTGELRTVEEITEALRRMPK